MPSVRPKNAHAHPVSKCHRLARPRAVVGKETGQSRVVELIADLLKDRDPPDANELWCFDLIRRFHRWGRRDTCHGLRLVSVPVESSEGKTYLASDTKPLTRRYIWEVACFQCATGEVEWTLVTWGIDEQVVHFQSWPTERAARDAFRQPAMSVLKTL